MIQEFYRTNTREYTNIPFCSGQLVFDSFRLQVGNTLVKLYNKAYIIMIIEIAHKSLVFIALSSHEGFVVPAQTRRLARAFAARIHKV